MNPEEFAAKAAAAGYSPDQITAFLKTKGIDWAGPPSTGQDVAAAAVNGLALGHLPDLRGAVKAAGAAIHGQPMGPAFAEGRAAGYQDQNAAEARTPTGSMIGKGLGMLAPALLSGGGAEAGVVGNALRGALTGGLAASGTEHPTVEGTGIGTAVGGGLAALLTPVAAWVGKKVASTGAKATEAIQRALNPAREIARAAGINLPKDAEQILARQEMLSPGTAVPGQLAEPLRKMSRAIGSDPQTGAVAAQQSAQRVDQLKQDLGNLGANYDHFTAPQGQPIYQPVTPEMQAVARANGIALRPMNPQQPNGAQVISAQDVQNLRTDLQTRLTSMQNTLKRGTAPVNGRTMHEMGQDVGVAKDWLHRTFGWPFAQLDNDYAFLSARLREARLLDKHIQQSVGSIASSRAAGIEPGSPAGAIPKSSTGILQKLMSPNRKDMAREQLRQLLTHGAPTAPLRAAQQSIMQATPPVGPSMRGLPGLLGLIGGASPSVFADPEQQQGLLQ